MKICLKCKLKKDKSEFYKNKANKDGLEFHCKLCKNNYHKKYVLNNKTKIKNYQKNFNKQYNQSFKGKFYIWKSHAKRRNINWNLTLEYLQSLPHEFCCYSNKKLTWKSNQSNTISLDRINSNKGYVIGNVKFCCWKTNCMKNDGTYKELLDYCKSVVKNKNNILKRIQ